MQSCTKTNDFKLGKRETSNDVLLHKHVMYEWHGTNRYAVSQDALKYLCCVLFSETSHVKEECPEGFYGPYCENKLPNVSLCEYTFKNDFSSSRTTDIYTYIKRFRDN